MCGIVGVIGSNNTKEIILDGLKKLEYRGYDSAGITTISNKKFSTIKQKGKISHLEELINKNLKNSEIGIGHTRWATHGSPSKTNAHPHQSSDICVVHNGIIENYQELKIKLSKNGANFLSQTDTEVIPHLIQYHYKLTANIEKSVIAAANEIKGSFALAIIFKNNPNIITLAKRGSPLVIGEGGNENYIASDFYAISKFSNRIINLEDGQFATITRDKIEIYDKNSKRIKPKVKKIEAKKNNISKEGYEHFMLKEIYEQPKVIQEIIETYVNLDDLSIHLPKYPFLVKNIKKITLVACGTSYYACQCAKYFIEDIADIEVEVDIASEYRYRKKIFRKNNLMIFVSQSGETADSLAALKDAKDNKQKILSIVNTPFSSMANLSDIVIRTVAGPEIGVASTKAYIAQLTILSLLAIDLGEKTGKINKETKEKYIKDIILSPNKIKKILENNNVQNIQKIAKKLKKINHLLYIGRGISYISSLESALKFKELTYIDAQGIAAGELKHGTIALIDKKMPVIVIAPTNNLFEKTLSNAQEVNARDGKIIFISDKNGLEKAKNIAENLIEIPKTRSIIDESIITIISTQLLAYYVALYKKNDVDQPRNLAKSVTVE